jgi:hypothetical protein
MERKVYSVYSIKPRAEEGRVFSVLVDGQDSALSTPMCLVINRLAIFQAVGCGSDSRLPLHIFQQLARLLSLRPFFNSTSLKSLSFRSELSGLAPTSRSKSSVKSL